MSAKNVIKNIAKTAKPVTAKPIMPANVPEPNIRLAKFDDAIYLYRLFNKSGKAMGKFVSGCHWCKLFSLFQYKKDDKYHNFYVLNMKIFSADGKKFGFQTIYGYGVSDNDDHPLKTQDVKTLNAFTRSVYTKQTEDFVFVYTRSIPDSDGKVLLSVALNNDNPSDENLDAFRNYFARLDEGIRNVRVSGKLYEGMDDAAESYDTFSNSEELRKKIMSSVFLHDPEQRTVSEWYDSASTMKWKSSVEEVLRDAADASVVWI